MKISIAILLFLLVYLQSHLWFGNNNMMQVWQIERAIQQQKAENTVLRERNAVLAAEVSDLKQGLEAIEERAMADKALTELAGTKETRHRTEKEMSTDETKSLVDRITSGESKSDEERAIEKRLEEF